MSDIKGPISKTLTEGVILYLIKSFIDVRRKVSKSKQRTIAVAAAHDIEVIKAINSIKQMDIANGILIGDSKKIVSYMEELNIDKDKFEIIHSNNIKDMAIKAVSLVREEKADILMKGLIPTADLLKIVLNKDIGLRSRKLLSHVAVFEFNNLNRILILSDAGINISPSLDEKKQIIENAVFVASSLNIKTPKVALIAAAEMVNPAMSSTIEAAALSKMADRGQIQNAIIDGPLALDNAISDQSAAHKGIKSAVAGKADILIVPNIEAGNVLYKSWVYFSNAKTAGILTGASVPIILTSRSDSEESKINSISLSVLMYEKQKREEFYNGNL